MQWQEASNTLKKYQSNLILKNSTGRQGKPIMVSKTSEKLF
jgi:hypothetical protein